jgi:hypothetical protein
MKNGILPCRIRQEQRSEETRSSRISQEFKGQKGHTHNALDDAIEQAQMFERMLTVARPPFGSVK